MKFFILVAVLLMSGCAPFVEYKHTSDPRIANDGFEHMCGGIVIGESHLTAEGAVCATMRGLDRTGDEFVEIGVRYTW